MAEPNQIDTYIKVETDQPETHIPDQEQTYIDESAKENIPINAEEWIKYIYDERERALQPLAQQGKKLRHFPDISKEPARTQYQRFRILLVKMAEFLQMAPDIRKETGIDKGPNLVRNEGVFHFPKADIDATRLLMDKWEAENWGANEVKDEDEADEGEAIDSGQDSEEDREPARKRRRTEHPIFGEKAGKRGIMFGVALKKGGKRRSYAFNPQLIRYKKSGGAYGSNGLTVGDWFPYQIVANFRGAHSASQAGISGNTQTGAYSIVVSGQYEDLDHDEGKVLYYSGSKSHENTDRDNAAPPSQGTQALHASLRSQRPVRVLRASTGNKKFAPTAGLRYDGLYKVHEVRNPRNMKGGLYEQFELVREEDQRPIQYMRPSPEQLVMFEQAKRGYA